jgi:large subunit ribosomal protein L25
MKEKVMAKNIALEAEKRERAGKGIARSLRREGRIPAVIYGDKKEPINISIDSNDINVEYYKGGMFTTLCDLKIGSDKHIVLARDVQLHPVSDRVEHVDFLRVNKRTKLAVKVPVVFTDEDKCPSLSQKGTVNVVRHTVELMCSAMNIPDQVEISLDGKEHGDAIHLSDIVLPEGSELVNNPRLAVATLVPPKTAAAEAAEAAASGEIVSEEAESEEDNKED